MNSNVNMGGKVRIVSLAAIVLVASASAAGCANRSLMIKRPANATLDQSVTKRWAQVVRSQAEHGDWLLSRSYSLVGDVIVKVTSGESFSHAAIYDAERDAVIEAISGGIRYVPLEKFLTRNDHVMLVRPRGLTAALRSRAVLRARSKIGVGYDYRGLFGVEDPERFYCSELVLWSIDPRSRGQSVPLVISPADLLKYSRTIWFSGTRAESHRLLAAERSGHVLAKK